jgi:hypothetical protein
MARIDLATGERTSLRKPDWQDRYTMFEDSILIDWPDTTVRPRGSLRRRIEDLRTRQAADSAALDLRWNWNTPFLLSRHNPSVFYAAANRVLKSSNRGDDFQLISPDLTSADPEKIRISTRETGGITPDITGAETYATIVALAESPIRPGLLYAGTDDGNVWLTRNDGANWEQLNGRFSDLPAESYVVRIEPSHHDTATVYVAFDRHRSDDMRPYLYVSQDFGKSFRSIVSDLPADGIDFLHVVREDPYNPNLLFVGSDVGVYVSLDRGGSWHRFMEGLPTVPVHDLQIHPRDRELIAATHGRSIWIVDIAPLEQLRDSILAGAAHLFEPTTAFQYGDRPSGGESTGQKWFEADSPSYGGSVVYWIAEGEPRSQVSVVITDVSGDTLQTLEGPGTRGLHRLSWSFRGKEPPAPELSPAQRRDSIVNVRKLDAVFDSLKAEGMDAQMLDRVKERMLSGNTQELFRAFRGGGRSAERGFVERPGESAAPRQRSGGRAAAAAPEEEPAEPEPAGEPQVERAAEPEPAEAEAAEAEPAEAEVADSAAAARRPAGAGRPQGGRQGGMPDQDTMREIFSAVREALGRGFGFGGRRGGAPIVSSGDYLVTLTVGEVTTSRVLRVERAGSR